METITLTKEELVKLLDAHQKYILDNCWTGEDYDTGIIHVDMLNTHSNEAWVDNYEWK